MALALFYGGGALVFHVKTWHGEAMGEFAYVGRTRAGRVVRGRRSAESPAAVVSVLRREQVVVTSIVAAKPARAGRRRVSDKALAIFTRQFSVLLDAGLPLVQCLDVLAKEQPDKRLAQAIPRVRSDVEGGASLTEALERQTYAFDSLYTSMVAAGETGGVLDTILQRLAMYLEKRAALTSHVRSAMAYPAVVLGVAAAAVFVILWQVVPTFTTLFNGLGAPLPVPTQIVIWASRMLVKETPVLLGALVMAVWLFHWVHGTAGGRMRIDAAALAVPLVGGVLRKIAVACFCRTLGTLTSSGVPILDGLRITARTAGNVVIQSAMATVRDQVERGEGMSAPLKATRVFPGMVVQMIAVGENTGALDEMLGKIAEAYEQEVDMAVKALLSLLEPLLIVILGVVVGGVVISMYLPLFSIVSHMSR